MTTATRARLVDLAERIITIEKQLVTLREPLARYRSVVDAEEVARTEYQRRSAAHNAEIERYVADGCTSDRPSPPCGLLEAEHAYAAATSDAAAARRLTVQADQAIAETQRRLDLLRAERDAAHREAVIEAVETYIADTLAPAVEAKNRAEHRIWNIVDALNERGDFTLAQTVADMVHRCISTVSAPEPEPSRGAAFLGQLAADPCGAQL
jgi:hypothetical protein